MTEAEPNVVLAYTHCIRNRAELERSKSSGCFYCLEVSPAAEIRETSADEELLTAMCPKCGIDAVLGDASGYPVTDAEFLQGMKSHWFDI